MAKKKVKKPLSSLAQIPLDALALLKRYGDIALRLTGTVAYTQEQLKKVPPKHRALLQEAGELIHDLREVAGLSKDELSEALDLSDESLLRAIEAGSASISFEIILRLSSLIARHDPIPFALQLIKAYQPELWEDLERWGIGNWPTHYERERLFLNVYRRNDNARELDDDDFKAALALTQATFNTAVEWINAQKAVASPEGDQAE